MEDDYVAIKSKKADDLLKKMTFSKIMPESVIDIQSMRQFKEILEKYSQSLIIIDFWAEWCMPCKAFAPHFEKLQKEYANKGESVIFAKVNIDYNPDIADTFEITAIPTTLFMYKNRPVYKNMGMMPAQSFDRLIKQIQQKLKI